MSLRKQVKQNAKKCLCNNWGKAISIVLLSTAIYLLFTIIEMIANLLLRLPAFASQQSLSGAWMVSYLITLLMAVGSFILIIPLRLGITNWYLNLSNGESDDILGIFSFFAKRKMFLRSLWLAIQIGVRVLLYSILYLIVPTAGVLFSIRVLNSSLTGSAFIGSMTLVFSAALFVLLFCFLLLRVQRYFLARYYLLDQQTPVRKAIRASIHATRGIRDEILLFKLSFLPLGISLVFILPVLYVSPYYSMCSMLYARFLIEQDRRSNSLVVASPADSQEPEDYPEDIAATRQFDPQHEERLEDE